MAKTKTQFVCRVCGGVQTRWMGKCPDCGEWDALEEFRESKASHDEQRGDAAYAEGGAPKATPISEVDETAVARIATTIDELDRVLGSSSNGEDGQTDPTAAPISADAATKQGESATQTSADADAVPSHRGLVPGSVVLVGGDPGIGKSTLLLQAADKLARRNVRVLYVTSEESAQQTRLRAARVGAISDDLFVLADTNLARIIDQARKVNPAVLVVDSIQMIYKGDVAAAPGSVTQLRGCCTELVYLAKATGMAVVLVGHVTKEGQLAGPRLLEHMVDAVLYFEGDRYHSHRIIRAIKNRFGTTLEVGIFEMTDGGMKEVADGGGLFAAEYRPSSGSVVCPVQHGSRCLLVEIQALTATSILGSAKRRASGLDANRLAMLIAVLEKRGGLRLADQDVFVNSVGGMKIAEPAADLAVALAIAGAHLNRQISPVTRTPPKGKRGVAVCAVGEIGLGGELRHVNAMAQRVREAARLGFSHVITPPVSMKAPAGCELVAAESLQKAMELLV